MTTLRSAISPFGQDYGHNQQLVRLCYRARIFLLGKTPAQSPPVSWVQVGVTKTHLPTRLISTYLSAFFALPVVRQSGERLSHEDVVNKLDNETVSYEVGLGMSNAFAETFRISIKVETAHYETAIAWLKDLMYGAEFDKERSVFLE